MGLYWEPSRVGSGPGPPRGRRVLSRTSGLLEPLAQGHVGAGAWAQAGTCSAPVPGTSWKTSISPLLRAGIRRQHFLVDTVDRGKWTLLPGLPRATWKLYSTSPLLSGPWVFISPKATV